MNVYVNEEQCIGCGLCVSTCPEVFSLIADGKAIANGEIKDGFVAQVESARMACPTGAIHVKDE